ncbi:MAG TPA: dolichyl-phosphate beta-glucosyltransferase [Chloroflexota bacterium]
MTPHLSVVIPAYNEERAVPDAIARVATFLQGWRGGELIVVDDGSQDRTAELVQEAQQRYPEVRLLRCQRNRGKGYAVAQGVMASRGRYVLYTDADLVYPIEGAEAFVRAIEEGADVAIGSRSHPNTLFALHPRHFSYIYQRYLVGRTYIKIVNLLLGLGVSDTQCGFKVFRGEIAREIFPLLHLHDFAFDVEALYIARQRGYRIVELPVFFLYLGEQSSVELVRDSLRMLRDLFIIRQNGRRGVYRGAPATTSPPP